MGVDDLYSLFVPVVRTHESISICVCMYAISNRGTLRADTLITANVCQNKCRYHGTHQSYRFENSGMVILLALLWGCFSLKIGDLRGRFPPVEHAELGTNIRKTAIERGGNTSGLIVSFVWAYSDNTRVWGTLIGGAIYVLMAYIIINFQSSLQLKHASWITIVTCCVMLGLAIAAGVRDEYENKNLATRSTFVWIWISLQAFFIVLGLFRKKMLPCARCASVSCTRECILHGSSQVHPML